VHEHILAAIVTHDESETLLRVEELHDALGFTDDLGRHSAPSAATAAAETAAATGRTAAAIAAATAAAEARTIAEARPVAICPWCSEPAAVPAIAARTIVGEKSIALVAPATSALAFTPFIETHARNIPCAQLSIKPTRWAHGRNRSARNLPRALFTALHEKSGPL
jgi:hypothetical protein